MKRFFETKYRIMPVYRNNKHVGYVVYAKNAPFGFWNMLSLDIVVTDVKTDNEGVNTERERIENNSSPAYFRTEQEALDFINRLKTIY